MNFSDSIQTCLRKYADFTGTASRPEFWWFFLFLALGSAILGVFSDKLSLVFTLLTLLPNIAVNARRLHDIDRSGWWQLVWFIPLIGWIVMIYWLVQPSQPNRYGAGATTTV
ncbi:DUF805 domain-containing protein [Roseateles chitinivorans]|uniref:DUF805 domain-containing protein n=1 Tax=Roseateles chitinivorans TaxID=2917965 RepID=UPI003D6747FE